MTTGTTAGSRLAGDRGDDRGDGTNPRWRVPWRVEGTRSEAPEDRGWTASWQRPGRSRFWSVLALLLAVNYLLSALALAPPKRLEVPYNLFREQVAQGNVAEVVASGDRIDGRFEEPVSYPEPGSEGGDDRPGSRDDQPRTDTLFTTERPSFADDGLIDLLLDNDVVVNAEPPDAVPLWRQLLLGFGPTILLVALLVWFARRSAAASGMGLGLGRSKAQRYTPRDGAAHDLRGRRGHRRGRAGGRRDRRLPARPGPLPPPRCHGPQGGAALWAARHR